MQDLLFFFFFLENGELQAKIDLKVVDFDKKVILDENFPQVSEFLNDPQCNSRPCLRITTTSQNRVSYLFRNIDWKTKYSRMAYERATANYVY